MRIVFLAVAALLFFATDVAAQQCNCGSGGCDQRGCESASCGAGNCNQDGVQGEASCGAGRCSQVGTKSPDCGAGYCNQQDSTGPSCGAGYCNQQASTSPSCGAGHCNQIGTTNATCGAGHCQQDNAINPTCGSESVGSCTQANATNPTCVRGDCCPPASSCSAGTGAGVCIGAEMKVFSCTLDTFVPAWEVSTGDSIRTLTSHGPVCSDVYYTFKHKSEHPAYSIKVKSSVAGEEDSVVLSPHHIAYVAGDTFDDRKAVMSENLRVGDKLLTSEKEGGSPLGTVVSIDMVESKLINLLTFEPAIALESGVVISAHSFNDALYPYVFWPFALAYKHLGVGAVEATTSILEKTEEFTVTKTIMSYYFATMLLSSEPAEL